jgi:choloylglycine hydrolase
MRQKWSGKVALVTFFLNISILNQATACSGISLKSTEGSVIVARTGQWALSAPHHNKIIVIPRKKTFNAKTPDGLNGSTCLLLVFETGRAY